MKNNLAQKVLPTVSLQYSQLNLKEMKLILELNHLIGCDRENVNILKIEHAF